MTDNETYVIAMIAILAYKNGDLDLIESETEANTYTLVVRNDEWLKNLKSQENNTGN